MADTAVHIFLENLKQLMRSDIYFTDAQKAQLQCLYQDVSHMSNFLKKTEEVRNENPEVNNLVVNVRDLVFDAENVIDLFLLDTSRDSDLATKLSRIKKEMESLKSEVEEVMANVKTVVGLEEKVDKLIEGLNNAKPLTIKSIVGLPGVGKTTLAQKLFDDTRTKEIFEIHAWVTVSQKYQKRGLVMDILQSSGLLQHVDTSASDDKLSENLHKLLKDKKYLIVMDDIWSIEAWKDIRRCFPDEENGSTIIFTSRDTKIGKAAGMDQSQTTTHYLNPLSEDESWKLLQEKVFGDEGSCPLKLEKIGKQIAKQCKGLPLAILVIGGLLAKNEMTPKWWNQVARSLRPTIATNRGAYMETLALSYTHLPLHLKACFLYLGMFPEDFEIPVRKLVWLLIAEGFVIQEDDKSLEVTAEGYLNELVDRNLVLVSRKRSNGATKACRIHDLLLDLSIEKGKEDRFLTQSSDTDQFPISKDDMLNKNRRRYIGSHTILENSLEPYAFKLRSLVCLVTEKAINSLVFNENDFKLLKVLDLLSINIPFPNEIGNLVLLKYLALWSDVMYLPSSITKLFNLETLIFSTENTLALPCDLLKMAKLRHLYNKKGAFHFDRISSLEASKSGSNILENLQTLHPLCSCNSCLELFVRTPNIKKLGVSGNLVSESGGLMFPHNLGLLEKLETLSCINTSVYSRSSTDLIEISLPSCLKRLTLKNTLLKWEEISVLGNLEYLEVLKLLDDACVVSDETSTSEAETDWFTSELEFPQLKYLKMRRLDIKKWDDSDLQFGSLEMLVVEECRKLEVIPIGLAQASSLRTIEVTRCNQAVEEYAKGIVEEHKELCGDDNLRARIIS